MPANHSDRAREPVLILFDQQCSICRLLASLLSEDAPRHWTFTPWQCYKAEADAPSSWFEKVPRELRVRKGTDAYFEGEEAWTFLLEEDPRLKRYQNLAARLGLSSRFSARWLRMLGHGVRKLCFSCRFAREG